MMTVNELTYLTVDEPGIGGLIKQRPEDFVVEEVPLDDPTGEGDYLWVFVDKDMRLTTDVVRLFAKHFKLPWSAIGYAGMKDKRAVTRQYFTIENGTMDVLERFEEDHIRIIDADFTDSPLRRGQLKGNRFDIKIRDTNPNEVLRVKRMLDDLSARGMPNFIGQQRFGYRNDNHLLGRLLIKGELQAYLDQFLGQSRPFESERNKEARIAYEAGDYEGALNLWPTVHRFERQALGPLSRKAPIGDAVNAIDLPHRNLLISAFQSSMFNQLLDQRVRESSLWTVKKDEVVMSHGTRESTLVTDDNLEQFQSECDEMLISPAGPMWGTEMLRAKGDIDEVELSALDETGVTLKDFETTEYDLSGSRRPYRLLIHDASVSAGADIHGPFVRLRFQLPRGSFATTLLREIMKVTGKR